MTPFSYFFDTVFTQPYTRVTNLVTAFHDKVADVGQFIAVSADDVPARSRELLHHGQHMTARLQCHYKVAMSVDVLRSVQSGKDYQREILLRRASDNVIVEYGVLKADLAQLPAKLQAALIDADRPFGQLIPDLGLHSRVSVDQLWRVISGQALATITGLEPAGTTFARLVSIAIEQVPAIEVLEILTSPPGLDVSQPPNSRRMN